MKTTIKLLALALVLFATACNNDDEMDMLNSLWRNVTQNEARIDALEKWCAQANTNISSLQTIVNVLESNGMVTSITPVMEGGVEIGYTITFSNHDPITIYHGKDGKDGQNGANGQNGTSPIVGVAQSGGVYYWTLNGEWLLDADGNKLPVSGKDGANGENGQNGSNGQNGVTPQLKIENDYWWISYDNGNTWKQLGKAKGEDGENGENGAKGDKGDTGDKGDKGDKGDAGDSMFQSVTQDADNVYFTLANGTVIAIAKGGDEKYEFTITYMPNGGEGEVVIDTVHYGCSYAIRNNAGTCFISWNTSSDGTGVVYTPTENIVVVKDIILYAQWFTPASFSVSNTTQVIFSPGNLQYHPANDEWRFAESQTDYIGDANRNVAADYNGWLDLFGFGTGSSPTVTSSYYDYPFVDWGTNQIGDDAPNTWRTLTDDEWCYLSFSRTNASSLKGIAQVSGVNGLILLPDGWSCPDGVTFKSGFYSSFGVDYYAAYQTFTADEWSKMESAGAVFLPAAGARHGSDVSYGSGVYNSSTPYKSVFGWCFYFGFGSGGAYHGDDDSYIGRSVRLVKDL